MNRRRLLADAGVLLAVALLPGCKGLRDADRNNLLQDALFQYASALRWGHINTANSFLKAPDGSSRAHDRPFRSDVRVTGYRMLNRAHTDDTHVQVEARLEYMSNATGQIERVDETQQWWYDADARRWYLDGTLPEAIVEP